MLSGSPRACSAAYRCLAALDDVLGAAHRMGGDGEDPDADGGEVLLDGRLGQFGAERLDIGRDMERLDVDSWPMLWRSIQAKKSVTAR
jgi:hypothetical protein